MGGIGDCSFQSAHSPHNFHKLDKKICYLGKLENPHLLAVDLGKSRKIIAFKSWSHSQKVLLPSTSPSPLPYKAKVTPICVNFIAMFKLLGMT